MTSTKWMVRFFVVGVAVMVCASGAVAQSRSVRSWEALQRVGKADRAYAVAVKEAEADEASWEWALRAAKSAGVLGDGAGAGEWLEACAERGYTGITTIENAAEFESVRADAGFLAGLEAVRGASAKRLEDFKAEAIRVEPRLIEPDGGVGPGDDFTLVIVLHGTGGRGAPIARSLADSLEEAGERAVVVGPDAVRPAAGGEGFAWTYLDEAAWYVEYLVGRYLEDYDITHDRVVLVGFSQGANVVLHLVGEKPGLMAGAIAVCGYVEEGQFDGLAAGDDAPRVSLIVGQRDPWVRTNREGVKALEAAGFEARLRELRGKGHEFPAGPLGVTEFGDAMAFVKDRGP